MAALHRLSVLLLLCLAAGLAAAQDGSWQGRSLQELLAKLEADGLPVIYSDELVRPEYTVAAEPAPGDRIERLHEVLAAHGLALVPGPGGSLLVVRGASPGSATRAPADTARQTEALPEIIVTSSVYNLRYESPLEHTFLDRELTTALPDVGDEPLRALWRLPGTAGGGVSTRQYVRGGLQNEQLYLLDGLRLYEPHHLKDFHQPASIIDQNVLAGIDFYAAAYPARFGDRMSGVVDMQLREPPADAQTQLALSLFNVSVLSMGQFGGNDRGDWLVSVRRGNLDVVADIVDPAYGSPRYHDLLGRVGLPLGDDTRLSANWLYSFDRITIAERDGNERARAKYRNSIAWLRLESDLRDDLSSDTQLSMTDVSNERSGSKFVPGLVTGSVTDIRDFRALALAQRVHWDASDAWLLSAGIDIKRLDAEYRYASMRTIAAPFDTLFDNAAQTDRAIERQPSGAQYAAWLEARWQPWSRLFVTTGLRWDQQTYTTAADDRQISPRLQLLYRPGPRTDIRVSAGQYYQAQEINELQVADGETAFYPAQRALHAAASLSHRFRNGIDLRLEAYDKRFHNLMPRYENAFDPLALIPELRIDRVRIDANGARARGIELTVSGSQDDLLWWTSYAYSWVEDFTAGGDVPRAWNQPHTLKAGVNWTWRTWQFSAAGTLHSGWPATRLESSVVTGSDGVQRLQLADPVLNGEEFSPFHALDVRVSRSYELPRSELDLFIEISNLYNRRNGCCVEYRPRVASDGSPELVADHGNWLPLVPSMGLLWRF